MRLETSACTVARRMVGLSLDVGTDWYRSLDGGRLRVRLGFTLWLFIGVTLKCRACHFIQERHRSLGCFDWRSVLVPVSVTLVRFVDSGEVGFFFRVCASRGIWRGLSLGKHHFCGLVFGHV